ncbi:MAG TPA: FAD-binding oxidoreductase, partial [Thermomicrobiales bacterium]|nr:FAD-binding oxidoreductase [Thermomicrobiales bacterium]
LQRSYGLNDVALLDGDEVRHRYPWLTPQIVVATYRGGDGWIDSARAVSAMAASSGCSIYLRTHAVALECENGKIVAVRTDRGRIACGSVVLAAGPFSSTLSPEPLPLATIRRHRVIVRPQSAIPQMGPVTIDANTGAHWRPHLGGALMAWAQPEAPEPAQWPVPADPEFVNLVLRGDQGIGRLAPFWHDLWPILSDHDIVLTAGQYTMTPDHHPLIGPARETDGLFLNTGYSGHGIMGAPAGARLLADIMDDADVGHNPYSPARDMDGSSAHRSEKMVI